MTIDPATRAAHAGSAREIGAPSATAIQLGSFNLSQGDPSGLAYAYGRGGNPTWEALEAALGEMESARATSFASGLAASFALLMALAKTHRRLVLAKDCYYGTRKQAEMLGAYGIELVLTDHADFAAVERELAHGPSILWSESPTNPRLSIHDLRRLAAIAKRHSSPFVVDNTRPQVVGLIIKEKTVNELPSLKRGFLDPLPADFEVTIAAKPMGID